MSDYTPSTKTVRRAYAQAGNSLIHEEARADTFDRWLAKIRAEAKAEALEEAAGAYPVMLRDMVSRLSVVAWLRGFANQYKKEEQ